MVAEADALGGGHGNSGIASCSSTPRSSSQPVWCGDEVADGPGGDTVAGDSSIVGRGDGAVNGFGGDALGSVFSVFCPHADKVNAASMLAKARTRASFCEITPALHVGISVAFVWSRRVVVGAFTLRFCTRQGSIHSSNRLPSLLRCLLIFRTPEFWLIKVCPVN